MGVNYFLRSFVTGAEPASRGHLNYVPSVYRSDDEKTTLTVSMAAVGLVALANSTQQPELATYARAKYAEAIHKVNNALASPVESIKDSTLMSVISLGVFEHISEYQSWVRHVEGAAALVVARGKSQFSSPAAIRMFNQVRADLVLACLHGARPFPKDMLELQEEASKYADVRGSYWLLGVLGTRCANLLFRVRNRKNTGVIPWPECLKEAIMIEGAFQRAVEILAVEEPYTALRDHDEDRKITFSSRVDFYRDAWAIRVWNNARKLQMILCEIMWYLLSKLLATDLAPAVREQMGLKLNETLQTLSILGNNILATVPQALEFVSTAPEKPPSVDLSFRGSVSGGYMLTWCLYMVGKCAVTKSETRKCIIQHLQDIGRNTGNSIALELAEDIVRIDQS
jgi:hypothetical protein